MCYIHTLNSNRLYLPRQQKQLSPHRPSRAVQRCWSLPQAGQMGSTVHDKAWRAALEQAHSPLLAKAFRHSLRMPPPPSAAAMAFILKAKTLISYHWGRCRGDKSQLNLSQAHFNSGTVGAMTEASVVSRVPTTTAASNIWKFGVFNALWQRMGGQITPSKTLTFQLYHSEHTIYLCTATELSEVYIFITGLFKISIKFLPPRQPTSLPICNSVFYSSFSNTKSHREQRRGTALCRAALPSAGTVNEVLWTSHSHQAGDGEFCSPGKEGSAQSLHEEPQVPPHCFLEHQEYCRELPKLNRLSFPSLES